MKYKAIVAYDGTDYAGWQIQPHGPTIVQVLQNSFLHIFKKQIKVIGASRTDARVHAVGQVIIFEVDLHIDPYRMQRVWNDDLPTDILIRSLDIADQDFHPRRNVRQKIYWYHLFQTKPLPMVARYGYFFPYKIDLKKLEKSLKIFEGKHDFRSFCTGDNYINTIRTINKISLYYFKRYNCYRIEVKGERFLHHMIRRIIGASLMVASKSMLMPYMLKEVLQARNPRQEFLNAPAKGLMLYKIQYNVK